MFSIDDDNSKIMTNENSTAKYTQQRVITKEYWDSVVQCKEHFLNNHGDQKACGKVNEEVYASWVRCRNYGVDPHLKVVGRVLSSDEFSKIRAVNHDLINIAAPLIEAFEGLTKSAGHVIYLCDKDGVFLLYGGDMMKYASYFPDGAGLIWNEETSGNCAHIMCTRLKRPLQLLGPEHYCIILRNTIVSAAPIMNECGEVIGSLVLGQELKAKPWEEEVQTLYSHTLGLVTAMATSIENKLQLVNSYNQLKITSDQLTVAHTSQQITLSFIDEGIITIDQSGKIIHINSETARMFHLDDHEIVNRQIKDFLFDPTHLMDLIRTGRNDDIEERFCIENSDMCLMVNIRPIVNALDNCVDGAVLKINSLDKINALVNSRTGAIAPYHFEDIIGQSKEIEKAINLSARFSNSPENVLLVGESGTGKEIFAQAIHNRNRPKGSFIAINCAAMPRNLIESELFGYERGSFTGAERSGRPGKIELANNGTLFLDEIGDMPFELQAVLLRVLEDKQVMRIGGQNYKRVDFRLIAATNKNLTDMVNKNLFREDLYFRLSVLTIDIPPLRVRGADIGLLSTYFINNYCKKMGKKIPRINPDVWQVLIEYSWPGNVRQLENAIIYAVNAAENDVIGLDNLPAFIRLNNNSNKEMQNSNPTDGKTDINAPFLDHSDNFEGEQVKLLTLEAAEKRAILTALLYTKNYVPGAADLLKISRSTLYRKLKEYNIDN